jgi:trans-aconitate methyltransferase
VPDYDAVWDEVYGDMQDVGPVHRHMRRIVAGLLDGLDYRTAAEVGCGAGHNLAAIAAGRDLDRLSGLDISPVALEAARAAWPQADFALLDIERERPDGRWDLVFCSLVLEHLEDDEAALGRLREMTAGHLLLTTIAGDFERYRPWEEQMGHVRNYARGELEAKLARAGFEVQRAIYWGFPFYSPLARTLQNRMTSEPKYNRRTRVLARLMYALYFLNSRRRGDLLVVLAR